MPDPRQELAKATRKAKYLSRQKEKLDLISKGIPLSTKFNFNPKLYTRRNSKP